MRLFVELHRSLLVASRRDRYNRAQRDGLENAAAIWFKQQRTNGVVLVGNDVDLGPRAEREIAQQMARGQRGDEEILRIVDIAVAPEHWIGAADQLGFPFDLQPIFAPVSGVARGTGTKVPVPDQPGFVVV